LNNYIHGCSTADLDTVTPTRLYSEWSIRFSTSSSGMLNLAIYDIAGSRVCTLMQENVSVGRFSLIWDGCDEDAAMLPQGVYFVRLRTPEGEQTTLGFKIIQRVNMKVWL